MLTEVSVLAKSFDSGFNNNSICNFCTYPYCLAPTFNPNLAPNLSTIGKRPPTKAPSCANFILFANLATAKSLPVFPSSGTLSTSKVGHQYQILKSLQHLKINHLTSSCKIRACSFSVYFTKSIF